MVVPGSVKARDLGDNIFSGMTILSAVLVDRYICCECGYSEEWIDTSDIPKLKKIQRIINFFVKSYLMIGAYKLIVKMR